MVGPARLPRRGQARDERVLPEPVQAARHQVVHQVVAGGDPLEDAVDQPLLLVEGDLAETEGGAVLVLVPRAFATLPAMSVLLIGADDSPTVRREAIVASLTKG